MPGQTISQTTNQAGKLTLKFLEEEDGHHISSFIGYILTSVSLFYL